MADILTDADRGLIATDLLDCNENRVRDLVDDFTRRIYEGQQTEHDLWFGSILEALSEDHFRPFRASGRMTRADIVTMFELAVADALDEARAWFDDDPAEYERYCHSDPHKDHPWGNDTLARCRLFIETTTPYQVWRFYKGVDQAALEALRDNLLAMAFVGEDTEYIGDRTHQATEDAIKALSEILDAQVTSAG